MLPTKEEGDLGGFVSAARLVKKISGTRFSHILQSLHLIAVYKLLN